MYDVWRRRRHASCIRSTKTSSPHLPLSNKPTIANNVTIIFTMNLLRSALMGIGVANVSTRCLAQTCQEIVSGSTDWKLEFLKEEAGGGGARGMDIHGIVGGTEVRRHWIAVPLLR
jgi:hypothetical protein